MLIAADMFGVIMFTKQRPKQKGEIVQNQQTTLLNTYSLDYIFRLAVEMRNLGLPWTSSG